MNNDNRNIDTVYNSSFTRLSSIYHSNFLILYILIDIYVIISLFYIVFKVNEVGTVNSYIFLLTGLIIVLAFFIIFKFILELKHYSVLISNNIIKIPILELFLPVFLFSLHVLTLFLLINDQIHYTIFLLSLMITIIVISWYMLLLSTIYIEFIYQKQAGLSRLTLRIKKLKVKSTEEVLILVITLGFLFVISLVSDPVLNNSIFIFVVLIILRFIYRHRQINRYIKFLNITSTKNGTLADVNIKKIHWS
jgi:hypothetical protein